MSWRTTGLKRAALSALHFSGTGSFMAPFTAGAGVIFSLQRVGLERRDVFAPSRARCVSPDFLETVLDLVAERGFEVLSLDALHYRLAEGDLDRPFACFTFDIGYRDVMQHAYPLFRQRGLPFAVYLATDYVDGRGDLWWLALEKIVAAAAVVEVKIDGSVRKLSCRTRAEKAATFQRMHRWLRRLGESDARHMVSELCDTHGIDVTDLCSRAVMEWDEVRSLGRDPLVTIGAHSRRYLALSGLSAAAAQLEIDSSIRRIESEVGRSCRHFSYPYGEAQDAGSREFDLVRELGLKTAVTARSDLVRPRHCRMLTALPRVALSGELQHARYVKVILSGVPYALSNGMRSVGLRAAEAW